MPLSCVRMPCSIARVRASSSGRSARCNASQHSGWVKLGVARRCPMPETNITPHFTRRARDLLPGGQLRGFLPDRRLREHSPVLDERYHAARGRVRSPGS